MAIWLIIIGAIFEALGFIAVALDLREVERPGRDRTCDLGIKSPAYRRKACLEKTPFQRLV